MADDSSEIGEPAPSPSPSDASLNASDAANAPGRPRLRLPLAVGVVVALVAIVASGIWYLSSQADSDDGAGPVDTTDVATEPLDEGMSFGTTGGPIVDVYVDYQCIHCAELDEVIGSELVGLAAAGDVELVIRPVKFVNRASGRAAAALYCAAADGQAFAMHQHLLADIGGDYSVDGLTASAGSLGLDETAFAACLTDTATTAWVSGVTATANDDGITSIPAVFVDGTRLSDAQLASAAAFRHAVLADGS
jgi:protein-disulfide isomerase